MARGIQKDLIYQGPDGVGYTQGIVRHVAHELGHLAINFDTDPGRDEQLNVDTYENPIMRELGDSRDRQKYNVTGRRSWFRALMIGW